MTLYYVWWEDSEVTTDTYKQTTNLVHETGFGPGGDDGDGNGGAGNSSVAVPKKGSGEEWCQGYWERGQGQGEEHWDPPTTSCQKREEGEEGKDTEPTGAQCFSFMFCDCAFQTPHFWDIMLAVSLTPTFLVTISI